MNKLNLTGNEKVNFARGKGFWHILESSQKESLRNKGICGTWFDNRGGEGTLKIENGVGCISCMVSAGYIKQVSSDIIETQYQVLVDFVVEPQIIYKMHFTSRDEILKNPNLKAGQIFGIGK